ncbi:hypothetical protein GGI43DRAFT_79823 [Trichoderma evansii]
MQEAILWDSMHTPLRITLRSLHNKAKPRLNGALRNSLTISESVVPQVGAPLAKRKSVPWFSSRHALVDVCRGAVSGVEFLALSLCPKRGLIKPMPIMTANCSMTRATGPISISTAQHRQLLYAGCHHPHGPKPPTWLCRQCTHITTSSNNEAARCPVPIRDTYGRAHGGQRVFLLAELSGRTEMTDPIAGPVIGLYRYAVWRSSCEGLTLPSTSSSGSTRSGTKHCQTAAYIRFFLQLTWEGASRPILEPFPLAGWRGHIKRKARRHGSLLHAWSRTKAQDSAVHVL